jgi:3-keto-5-aminohexanoate cleavage enzyme
LRKVIISVAPVAGPAPVDPDALSKDVIKCTEAGAAMCHLHVKTREGVLTPDTSVFVESFEKIAAGCNIVVQASTGGVSKMNIQDRCNPLEYWRVESASLNGGSCNLGEAVYSNSFDEIRYCAKKVYEHSIIPEFEVFEIGMINNILTVEKELPFRKPLLFNLVFGHKGIMQPTIDHLIAFRSFLPKDKDTLWGVTHYGRDNWEFIAAAIAMGATVVRIGFEDSNWLDEGQKAEYNYQLVSRLVKLIKAMGLEPATPEEAREILRIEPRKAMGM